MAFNPFILKYVLRIHSIFVINRRKVFEIVNSCHSFLITFSLYERIKAIMLCIAYEITITLYRYIIISTDGVIECAARHVAKTFLLILRIF